MIDDAVTELNLAGRVTGRAQASQRVDWHLAPGFQELGMADETSKLSGSRLAGSGSVALIGSAIQRRCPRQPETLVKSLGNQEQPDC